MLKKHFSSWVHTFFSASSTLAPQSSCLPFCSKERLLWEKIAIYGKSLVLQSLLSMSHIYVKKWTVALFKQMVNLFLSSVSGSLLQPCLEYLCSLQLVLHHGEFLFTCFQSGLEPLICCQCLFIHLQNTHMLGFPPPNTATRTHFCGSFSFHHLPSGSDFFLKISWQTLDCH